MPEKKAGAAPVCFLRRKLISRAKAVQKHMILYILRSIILQNKSLPEYLCLVREPEKMIIVQATVA